MPRMTPVRDRLELTPRFHEIDSYGIVHHSAYFCWFEEGRQRLLEQCGIDLSRTLSDRLHFVLINAEVDFKVSVRPFQKIWVETSLIEKPVAKLTFRHQVLNPGSRQIMIDATISLAILQDGHLLLNLPGSIRANLDFHQGAANAPVFV